MGLVPAGRSSNLARTRLFVPVALLVLAAGCERSALPYVDPNADGPVPARALPGWGIVYNSCGDLDGPAMGMNIGARPSQPCLPPDEHWPQLRTHIQTGWIPSLKQGMSWSSTGTSRYPMGATWLPAGTNGPKVDVPNATIRVLSVKPIIVHYDFDAADGTRWSGVAELTSCENRVTCGG